MNRRIGHKTAQAWYLQSDGDENLNEFKVAYILNDLLGESEIHDRPRNHSRREQLIGETLA
jgi:hypothetical protein